MEQKNNKIGKCPNCGSKAVVTDEKIGETVCSECGFVLKEIILDKGPEYRVFNTQENSDRRRVGSGYNINLYDKGLSTIIRGNRDSSGKPLDRDTLLKMNRLRRRDNISKINEAKHRNLSIAMAELDRLASELNLPNNLKKEAAVIYRKALEEDLIRGRSIDAFVAACIYAACRLLKVPRSLKQVTMASKRLHSEVALTYRLLLRELDIKPPVDGPYKFIPSIASKLDVSPKAEQLAVDILRKADEHNELVGKNPRGVAAAALYIACIEADEKRSQEAISKAADTTTVTIRNRLRGLRKVLDEFDTQPVELDTLPVEVLM